MIARILISSLPENRFKKIAEILKEAGLYKNHPDLLLFQLGSKLGIEQARKIKEHFSKKPYQANGRAVVLEDASTLTTDAQNALLKLLEEPPPNAILILAASSDGKFLPTILSRCQIIKITDKEFETANEEHKKDIEKLLSSLLQERFEFVEKLKEKEEFLNSMVQYFHNSRNTKYQDFLKELSIAESWSKQNVNIRAVLEYLMQKMPEI